MISSKTVFELIYFFESLRNRNILFFVYLKDVENPSILNMLGMRTVFKLGLKKNVFLLLLEYLLFFSILLIMVLMIMLVCSVIDIDNGIDEL